MLHWVMQTAVLPRQDPPAMHTLLSTDMQVPLNLSDRKLVLTQPHTQPQRYCPLHTVPQPYLSSAYL